VLTDPGYAEHRVELEAGTVLVGYTDGLLERRGHDLAQTLHSLIRALRTLPPDDLADPETVAARILELTPPGDGTDDTALLVLAPRPGSRPRA
jgi:serine phosphatase RsbU (regulator of sigma subunit)